MAWDYDIPDDVPIDDQGRPLHPERGYPICGYRKTDATANNGRKREDVAACLQSAGWGTDRDVGACKAHYGGSPGGKEGWANGNARHLLYSQRMNDDDKEIFETVIHTADGEEGELIDITDMSDMLKQTIGWEFTRLTRALEYIPEAELVEKYSCPNCGAEYTKSESSPLPDTCTGFDMSRGHPEPCEHTKDMFKPTGEKFVTFSDKAIERKEKLLANLIQQYKKVADGVDLNVKGEHEHTHEGGDAPMSVNISHVGVDLPDEVDPTSDDNDDE